MRTSKLISMLMLPAAFVACTNEDIIDDNFAINEQGKEVVEDLMLNVSLDQEVLSRGQYAGATDEEGNKSIFQNFYLEPEFDDKNAVKLTDNEDFYGDMLGFSLVSGENAITNMPFYIAGYGSTKGKSDKTTTIYQFSKTNVLYELNFDEKSYTKKDFTKDLYDQSVKDVAKGEANEVLADNALDVRKGIVRNNAGVMTGNYIAYYPYNAEFTEPGGVPVVKLPSLRVLGKDVELSNSQAAALTEADFYGKLFAISQSTNAVDGKTKSGNVSLLPRTGAIFFKIYNSTTGESVKNDKVEIKRITVQAATNAAATDFVLEGYVPMNDLDAITATKSNSLVGVQFAPVTIATGYDAEDNDNAKWVMIPAYPVGGKSVKLEVYNNEGEVATIAKTSIPGLGKSVVYTVDLGKLTFEKTTRKVFTAEDFEQEIGTEGTLELMGDIEVTNQVSLTKKLTIKGAHKLTLKNATISEALVCEEGVNLVLGTVNFNAALTASKVTVPAGATATFAKNTTITTLDNNGTMVSNAVVDEDTPANNTTVAVTTLNNKKGAVLTVTGPLTVGTLNNQAGAVVETTGKLSATTINNAAAIADDKNTTENEAVEAAKITVKGETAAATVVNKGWLTWESAKDFNLAVENEGNIWIKKSCKFTGSVNNTKGDLNIEEEATVQATAGTITNGTDANCDINVNGSLILQAAKLNINGGRVIDNGQISGASNITVAEGAEFIKLVVAENTLTNALGTTGTAAKYTGVKVTADVIMTADVTASKKIYLESATLTFNKKATLNGGLVINGNTTTTGSGITGKDITITIAKGNAIDIFKGGSFNVGESSNVVVNGTILNNGTFSYDSSAVVTCTGISGEGVWTNYPNF